MWADEGRSTDLRPCYAFWSWDLSADLDSEVSNVEGQGEVGGLGWVDEGRSKELRPCNVFWG